MKSYKSFKQLSTEYSDLLNQFADKDEYWAHTSKDETRNNETLHEHVNKVQHYFNLLVESHGLEARIDRLISGIAFEHDEVGSYIKTLFLHSIVFHDYGKINANFQLDRLKNTHFKKDTAVKIGSNHSFLSATTFLNYHIYNIYQNNDISPELKNILWCYTFLFTIPILKHHSTFLTENIDFELGKIHSVKHLLDVFDLEFNTELVDRVIPNQSEIWKVFNKYIENKQYDFFALFGLIKLNFSLLTAADYYATFDYVQNQSFTSSDWGLIDENLKQKIFHAFENSLEAPYNREIVYKTSEILGYKDEELQEKSPENLRRLRLKMGAEVLNNIEGFSDDRLFYIEAPTGGGKTNMSFVAIRKLLEMKPEINKVFYVFPFTTLITQTTEALKNAFGLDNSHVAQLHSKAGLQTKGNGYDTSRYGQSLRNQVDNLFVNFPFTLITHVKFFDILKSNQKDTNYLLHRLANSVIILDELQSYNPDHWDKIKYFIANYAELFNIRFILMSATLPKIDKINLTGPNFASFKPLLKDAAARYLQNPNFAKRVDIRTELLREGKIEIEKLADKVFEESERYAHNREDSWYGSVYAIIEFIFKKSATEFYSTINKRDLFFDYEVFVLSGTILEPRRRYIIEYLKDKANRNKKILLITTQVVEAGVDIDMDIGFKNQSLIDSDEQLAGRINRNVEKAGCELWLFKYNPPSFIYGSDRRYEVAKKFSSDYIQDILSNKRFELLYEDVFGAINKDNNAVGLFNITDYTDYVQKLNFQRLHKEFQLIDSENASLFIPVDVDVWCYNEVKNFSEQELFFIRENSCFVDASHNQVSGEKIWDIYSSIILNKEIPYGRKSMDLKILHGIMSKFVFSLFYKKIDELKPYMDYHEDVADFEFFQYYKLNKSSLKKIYNYRSGLDESALKSISEFL